MPSPASKNWQRFLEKSSLIRAGLWKYRKLVFVGLLSLLIVDLLEIAPPLLLKKSIDAATEHRPAHVFLTLAGVFLFISIFQGLGRYGWRMYLIRASMLAGRDVRQSFAHQLFQLSASFYDRTRIGDLMTLATSDAESVRMAVGAGLLTFADAMIYLFTVPFVMFALSPKLTLLAFLPLPIIPWFVIRTDREIHARYEKVQESASQIAAHAQETLNGIRIIKGFAREDARLGQFRTIGSEYVRLSLDLARVQSSFGPFLDFAMSLGFVLLLWFGGRDAIAGTVTIGTFVAFQRYIQKLVWPMTALGIAFAQYQRAVASSGRIKELLAEKPEVAEASQLSLPEGFVPGPYARTAGRMEFKDLSFRYIGTNRDSLCNVTLTIERGSQLALVGSIGSGKSTLLSLIPRVYDPPAGTIFLDGIDIREWPLDELRRQIGYVTQDVFLFSESVAANIGFGFTDAGSASDLGRIERHSRIAEVHEEILRFPMSYQTRLGERGANLSGGQKQRITLARALAQEPAVLILDDALSAVDTQTEERILRNLRSRPGRNTELVAAHRISTVKEADLIVVLAQGSIAQMGTHAELIRARSGIYSQFYEQQRLREDLENYLAEIGRAEAHSSGDAV